MLCVRGEFYRRTSTPMSCIIRIVTHQSNEPFFLDGSVPLLLRFGRYFYQCKATFGTNEYLSGMSQSDRWIFSQLDSSFGLKHFVQIESAGGPTLAGLKIEIHPMNFKLKFRSTGRRAARPLNFQPRCVGGFSAGHPPETCVRLDGIIIRALPNNSRSSALKCSPRFAHAERRRQ